MHTQQHIEVAAQQIQAALEAEHFNAAVVQFNDLHYADQALVFNLFEDDLQELLIKKLDIESTAELFTELEDDETLEAAGALTIERLADVLDEMEPDEAADLLGDLPPAQATEALAQMDEPEDVLPLLGYPDETAGGRMTTAYLALRRQTTTAQAIEFLREVSPDNDVPYYLFVTDPEKRLAGVIGLRELVIAPPNTIIENIMDPEVNHVDADADQEEAARLMARYDLSALPVVNELHELVGVITHDDLVDVLEDEATEDIYQLANVSDTDLEPESAIRLQLRGRLPWLFINTGTALFASWVISQFEPLIAQIAVLAIFQSVVAGQGGNAGSQSVAMIVRALALDRINPRHVWRILRRQALVGLLQGIIVGSIVGLGVALWRGNPFLGLVLGLAVVGNMLVAGIAGTLMPLGLKAIGQDPALASSVLVTAVTDSCGFFIFLSLATVFMPQLLI